MSKQVKRRRGTTSEHDSFTGAEAEITIDTDKNTAVVHDGATQGGFPLAKEDLSNVPASAELDLASLDVDDINIDGNTIQAQNGQNLVLDGNGNDVLVNGDTIKIDKEMTTTDNIIVLNDGEVGSGITAGSAGAQFDRGTEPDYQILFQESNKLFSIGEVGSLQAVATRPDSPDDTGLGIWNESESWYETSSDLTFDGSELLVGGSAQFDFPSSGELFIEPFGGGSAAVRSDGFLRLEARTGSGVRQYVGDDIITQAVADEFEVNQTLTGVDVSLSSTLDVGGLATFSDDIMPNENYASNIGSPTNKFLSLNVAEFRAEIMTIAERKMVSGGRVNVATGEGVLTSDVGTSDTSIDVDTNGLLNGNILHFEKVGQVEFIEIVSAATDNGDGTFTYDVTRDLDGSGANAWLAGDGFLNTGSTGAGFIDMYAVNSLKTGVSTAGPTTAYMERTGTGYNDIDIRAATGNLNGWYGYSSDTYGAAFGDEEADYITIDPDDGIRFLDGADSDKVLGQFSARVITFGDVSETNDFVKFDNSSGTVNVDMDISAASITAGNLDLNADGASSYLSIGTLTGISDTTNKGVYVNNAGELLARQDGDNYLKIFDDSGTPTVDLATQNLSVSIDASNAIVADASGVAVNATSFNLDASNVNIGETSGWFGASDVLAYNSDGSVDVAGFTANSDWLQGGEVTIGDNIDTASTRLRIGMWDTDFAYIRLADGDDNPRVLLRSDGGADTHGITVQNAAGDRILQAGRRAGVEENQLAGLDFDSGSLVTGDGNLNDGYTAGTVTGMQPRADASTPVLFAGADDEDGTNAGVAIRPDGTIILDEDGEITNPNEDYSISADGISVAETSLVGGEGVKSISLGNQGWLYGQGNNVMNIRAFDGNDIIMIAEGGRVDLVAQDGNDIEVRSLNGRFVSATDGFIIENLPTSDPGVEDALFTRTGSGIGGDPLVVCVSEG